MPYEDAYANKIKSIRDTRLIFTGYITDQEELAELYHNSLVYFHGHEFGGTNPALLQALAYGCAVCALDTVFNREMLLNGEYGFFFKKDSGDLENRIDEIENGKIMLNNYKQISRERIEKNYTWEKITKQYIDLLTNLVNKTN